MLCRINTDCLSIVCNNDRLSINDIQVNEMRSIRFDFLIFYIERFMHDIIDSAINIVVVALRDITNEIIQVDIIEIVAIVKCKILGYDVKTPIKNRSFGI